MENLKKIIESKKLKSSDKNLDMEQENYLLD